MAKRLGKNTIELEKTPFIVSSASVVGKKEGEGPLAQEFDRIFEDTTIGLDSWEKAESELIKTAIQTAEEKAGLTNEEIDIIFSGDLLNQCMSSTFAIRDTNIPFAGLYGACSTMALSLCMASLSIETGGFHTVLATTSSHFCSAEKQFRYPLEYGGQRSPCAEWTVTGSGAVILSDEKEGKLPKIKAIHIGTIQDLGITDVNNMGAAMAPAAAKTIADFLNETQSQPKDYDLILTGDLGFIGSKLLIDLINKDYMIDISLVHNDCGMMIFDREKQDVHAGGSGCGCSASVFCSKILRMLKSGSYKKIMFVATGALLSGISSLQGESIPGIAHGLIIES